MRKIWPLSRYSTVRQVALPLMRIEKRMRPEISHPIHSPAATTASTPDTPRCSAGKYAANGTSSETSTARESSSIRWKIRLSAQPIPIPMPIPPAATQRNRSEASEAEKCPVARAASANFRTTSPLASFTRLSPSRITTRRLGSRRRRATAATATASGGDTMPPRTNPSARDIPGISRRHSTATPAEVKRTNPTASRPIGRRLRRNSRHEVK